ncbi:hypothetical protein JTB14_020037 [Gonioctena quinquepunctata]|nr:hypothetical protein JTB14_020037 [Gonioctena quinquepunctata]
MTLTRMPPVTLEEIKIAVSKIENEKAPGPVGIAAEIICIRKNQKKSTEMGCYKTVDIRNLIVVEGIYPSHNFRMVYFTFMAGMVLIALSYFGQILSDESSRLYDQLNICDWINWNQSNRRHLLIILPAIAEPITLSCPGLVDVDLRLLLFVCRGIYTVFTALMNMHN